MMRESIQIGHPCPSWGIIHAVSSNSTITFCDQTLFFIGEVQEENGNKRNSQHIVPFFQSLKPNILLAKSFGCHETGCLS